MEEEKGKIGGNRFDEKYKLGMIEIGQGVNIYIKNPNNKCLKYLTFIFREFMHDWIEWSCKTLKNTELKMLSLMFQINLKKNMKCFISNYNFASFQNNNNY